MSRVGVTTAQRTTKPKAAETPAKAAAAKKPAAKKADSTTFTPAPKRTTKPPLLGAPATLHVPATKELGPATGVAATIAGVPVVSAKELAFEGLTGGNALMGKTVDVQFGTLSKDHFDALKKEFGGRSTVKFDATREYAATDFLPTLLQAIVNRDLDPGGPFSLKGTKKLNDQFGNEGRGDLEINSSPNCHGTAWESMRAYQGQIGEHANLLYGDGQMMEPTLTDAAQFESLGTAVPGEIPAFLANLEPGDVVALREGEYTLLHTAVYVGGGLFFEKPDTESDKYGETPYRLATWPVVSESIGSLIGSAPTPTAYRPKQQLPSGLEAFSAGDDAKTVADWAAKKGQPLTKPLVREFEVSLGGGIRGLHLNAVETIRLSSTPDGRAIVA